MSEQQQATTGENDGQLTAEENGGQSASDPANESSVPLTEPTSSSSQKRKGPSPNCLKTTRMATSLEDITSLRLWRGVMAEFVGVLLLVLVGCGSCISLEGGKSSSVVQIALCFGLSVGTIVWNIAHISGGHINPAVTFALLATRKISLAKGVLFVVFQLVGAAVGAALLMGLTPEKYHGSLGSTLVSGTIDPAKGVGVEIFITFVLVFTVFASIDSRRRDLNGSAPLTIGLSVTMCHLFAVQYTGSSMNTARSFGPALVTGNWRHHWVYWVGPITGGVAAGLMYEYIFAVNASLTKLRACMLTSDYDDEKFQAQKIRVRIVEEDPEAPGECLPLADADGDKTPLEEVKSTEIA
ncbi:hypothetical protein ACOMHN_050445 [Nucella lapillus]